MLNRSITFPNNRGDTVSQMNSPTYPFVQPPAYLSALETQKSLGHTDFSVSLRLLKYVVMADLKKSNWISAKL